MSKKIAEIWDEYAQELAKIKERTTDDLQVWGQPNNSSRGGVPLAMKDKIYEQEKLSQGVSNASKYRRLKLVMEYWCALWFWPIERAEELPSREQFLQEVGAILGETEMLVSSSQQLALFPETQSAEQAVLTAYTIGKKGDTVLLSPACASFDLFESYEERGNKFKQAVRNL